MRNDDGREAEAETPARRHSGADMFRPVLTVRRLAGRCDQSKFDAVLYVLTCGNGNLACRVLLLVASRSSVLVIMAARRWTIGPGSLRR